MAIGEFCNREVVVVGADATVAEAARLMRKHHVGDLVVVRMSAGKNKPIGIVTDRDLVVEVMAAGLDPSTLSVGEIMGQDLAKVKENTGVSEVIRYMRDMGVRRMPVVGSGGALVGLVTLDDLLALLSEELAELTRLTQLEQKRETKRRR